MPSCPSKKSPLPLAEIIWQPTQSIMLPELFRNSKRLGRNMRNLLLAAALSLAACVSQEMASYMGKDITEVFMTQGHPVDEFDLPDGNRAFQFYWGGGAISFPSTSTTTVTVVGNQAFANTQGFGGGVVHSQGCLITYIGTPNDKKSWTVTAYRYPDRLVC
jgi:hypothetical protein